MVTFGKEEYLKIEKVLRGRFVLREESAQYNLNNAHDKIFRELLADKKEVAKFLSKYLKTEEKINSKNLERCNTNYITTNYRNKQADILYKKKNENIYFLIEHQSSIDQKMIYRIFTYCYEIIRSEIEVLKIEKKGYEIPKVVPIVLYTEEKKWNAKEEIEKVEYIKEYGLELKYNLIETRDKKELLEDELFISKIILLEKSNDIGEVLENVNIIAKKIKTNKEKEKLINIARYILKNDITKEEINKIIKTVNLKEKEKKSMIGQVIEKIELRGMVQGLEKGIEQGLEKGRVQGLEKGRVQGEINKKREIALKLLRKKMKIEEIVEVTGLSKKEIEAL